MRVQTTPVAAAEMSDAELEAVAAGKQQAAKGVKKPADVRPVAFPRVASAAPAPGGCPGGVCRPSGGWG